MGGAAATKAALSYPRNYLNDYSCFNRINRWQVVGEKVPVVTFIPTDEELAGASADVDATRIEGVCCPFHRASRVDTRFLAADRLSKAPNPDRRYAF